MRGIITYSLPIIHNTATILHLLYSLYQRTPLHTATKNNHDYTVERLVDKKANIRIQDKKGVSVTTVEPL